MGDRVTINIDDSASAFRSTRFQYFEVSGYNPIVLTTMLLLKYLVLVILSIKITIGVNILDGLKTGVLYQFELSSQIRLTNGDDTKTVDELESSAMLSMQLLHWDRDGNKRILVIWVDNCVNTFCPTIKEGESSSSPLKLFSIWHGSQISEILSSETPQSDDWNILRSFIFQLQYQLNSVKLGHAGLCDSQYSETNPVTRRLIFCRLAEETMLIDKAFDFSSNFTQTSQYFFDASSKLRQLSIGERYDLSTALYSDAHSVLISQSKWQLIDQSESATPSGQENAAVEFNAYVEILKKDQGLQRVSESIEQLFTSSTSLPISHPAPLSEDKCSRIGGIKMLQRLKWSAKTGIGLKTLIQLSKYLKSVDQWTILDCLNTIHLKQPSLIGPVLDSMAVVGPLETQKAILQLFDENKDNSDRWEKTYLVMVAHNLWPRKIVREIMSRFEKSIETGSNLDEYLALAVASLARRSGDTEVQGLLLKLLDDLLSRCKNDACLEISLRALRNLAHPNTANHVGKYMCHRSDSVAREALESLRSVDWRHWTNRTLQDLARVYANECPSGKSEATCRTTAAEMLLKVGPNQRWSLDVGTLLLRPLQRKWNRKEREVYTYTLAKMFDLANVDEEYRKLVSESVKNYLENDYSRLAHGGMSAVHSGVAAVFPFARIPYQLNMEFGGGLMKRSNVDVIMEGTNGVSSPVLSFGLFSRGLESILGEGDFSDDGSTKEEESTAGMRLTLFDQLQPPLTFFTGQSELMRSVWTANGDPMTAFEGRFLLINLNGAVPLATGHTIAIHVNAAIWWKLTGAIEISLWYRNAHTTIASKKAVHVQSHITVQERGQEIVKNVMQDNGTMSADLDVDFVTDIDFSETPFRMCLQMNQPPVQIKFKHHQMKIGGPTSQKQVWKREQLRRLGAHCFLTEPKVVRECGQLLQHLGRA